jgi:hypothetical protein
MTVEQARELIEKTPKAQLKKRWPDLWLAGTSEEFTLEERRELADLLLDRLKGAGIDIRVCGGVETGEEEPKE